jgi:pimeloyl-ACP methyl ester carboxylesterase
MNDIAPAALAVPAPADTFDLTTADGAVIRLRRHGNPRGRRVALSHGNGLAIDAYFPFWRLLLAEFDVIVFDQRNHGRNPRHRAEDHVWPRMAEDSRAVFGAIAARFGDKPVIGAFHSLSSIAAVDATQKWGAMWRPLILFDPPMFPRQGHPLDPFEREHMGEMAAIARRRPTHYPDPAAFATQLARREQFRRWVPGAHLLYAQSTLRPDPKAGGWTLCCPREWEARIFEENVDPRLWPRMPSMPAPTFLIGADPEIAGAQAPSILTDALAKDQGLPYIRIAQTSHFLQIERPEACMDAFRSHLAAADAVGR